MVSLLNYKVSILYERRLQAEPSIPYFKDIKTKPARDWKQLAHNGNMILEFD